MMKKKHILYAALVSIIFYSCTEINLLTFNTACIDGDISTAQGIMLATLSSDDDTKDILFSKNSNNEHLFSGANTLTDPTNKQLYVGGNYTFQNQGKKYQNNMTLFSLSPIVANTYIDYNTIDKDIGYAKALGNGLMGLISSDKQTVYIVSIYGEIIFTKTTDNEFTTFETTWSKDNIYGLLAIGGNNIDGANNDGMLIPLRQSASDRCKYTAESKSFKLFQSKDLSDSTIVDIVIPNDTSVNIIDKTTPKTPTSNNAWPLFLLVDYGTSRGIAIEHITLTSTTPFSSLAKAVTQEYTLGNNITLRPPKSSDLRPFIGDSMVFISNNNYIGLLVLMHRNNNTIHAMSFVQEKSANVENIFTIKEKNINIPPSKQEIEGHTFKSFSPYMRVHDTRLAIGAVVSTSSTRFFSLLSFSVFAPELPTKNSALLKSELIRFEKKLIPQNIEIEKVRIKDFIYK